MKELLKLGSCTSHLMYSKKLCGIGFYHSLFDIMYIIIIFHATKTVEIHERVP